MSETNKYQNCFYLNEILELYKIEEEYYCTLGSNKTKAKYKDQLFCPGCAEAHLVIKENQNGIFLSAYPKATHGPKCFYNGLKSAGKKELVEHYEKIEPEKASNLLSKLFRPSEKHINDKSTASNKIESNNDEEDFELVDAKGVRKYLPRRSILLRKMEVSDHLVMYYGNCRVSFYMHKTDSRLSYYLRIFRNNTEMELICSLYLSENVYRHLDNDMKFIPINDKSSIEESRKVSVVANIGFISTIKKYNDYYNGQITHSKLLLIKES